MKKILFTFVAFVLLGSGAFANEASPSDTIVINFGNNTKILFVVKNRQDLKALKNYDLNAMLNELSLSVDTLQEGQKYLRIEDSSGTRFLKDTTIVMENKNEAGEPGEMNENNKDNQEFQSLDKRNDEWNRDHRKHRRNQWYGTRNYFNFDFGVNNYLENGKFPDSNDELYTVKPWGSWYVGITNTNRTHVLGPLFLDWGFGVNWYNFKFQNAGTWLKKTNTQTLIYNDTSMGDPTKSKLTATYINAFFVPMFNFGNSGRKKDIFHWGNYDNGFRLGGGLYAGYRVDSYTKNVWDEGGKSKSRRTHDNYYLNNLRYGIRAQMGFQSLDLFMDYDMSDLFISGRGPKLNPISFGIIF